MYQFYCLSVMLNLVSGILLVYMDSEKKDSGEFYDSKAFRLVIGALSFFVGFAKLFSVMQSRIYILGDLFPAVAGMMAGLSILTDYYISVAEQSPELPPAYISIFVTNRKYIGICCIVVAVLHFIFPGILFL